MKENIQLSVHINDWRLTFRTPAGCVPITGERQERSTKGLKMLNERGGGESKIFNRWPIKSEIKYMILSYLSSLR